MSLSASVNTDRSSWFSFTNATTVDKSIRVKKKGSNLRTSVIDYKTLPFFSKRRSFVVRDVRHVAGNSFSSSPIVGAMPSPQPVKKDQYQDDQHQYQYQYQYQQQQLTNRKHKSEVLLDHGTQDMNESDSPFSYSTIGSSEIRSLSTPTLPTITSETCRICTNFEAIPNKMLVCGHIFHENCIRGWDGQCPTCTIY